MKFTSNEKFKGYEVSVEASFDTSGLEEFSLDVSQTEEEDNQEE